MVTAFEKWTRLEKFYSKTMFCFILHFLVKIENQRAMPTMENISKQVNEIVLVQALDKYKIQNLPKE